MRNRIIVLLLVLNMLLTFSIGIVLIVQIKNNGNETEQYVMYVGTNDKDTYTQLISTEKAIDILDEICLKYLDGYTIQVGYGRWSDEKGIKTNENTIICYFDYTDINTVHKIADEVIDSLNQNSVLIETGRISSEYYTGK